MGPPRTPKVTTNPDKGVAAAVRQPKAAAVAGLAFGLILTGVLVLLQSATPTSVADSGTWMTDLGRRDAVSKALALIPFAGIAFLWFIAVVRSSLGGREDRFFDALFTGSGLLFVAMLFASAAVLMSALALADAGVVRGPGADAEAWALASALLGSFGARMAAVFTLAVTTSGLRAGSLPRLLALLGYATGALLLLTPPLPRWAQLLFPVWVMGISIHVLIREQSTT
jgi:hypothetical protein